MQKTNNIIDVLSELSHDVKNDFVSIRAIMGSIKKQHSQSEDLHKKIEAINHLLNTATQRFEKTYALLK